MTFFEQELRRIVKMCEMIHNPKYVGRDCIVRLTDDVTAKLSFRDPHIADKFTRLQIKLMNRRDGEIDTQNIDFKDVWGKVFMQAREEWINPYFWIYGDRIDWYGFHPNELQYDLLSRSVDEYLEYFAEPEQTEEMDITM